MENEKDLNSFLAYIKDSGELYKNKQLVFHSCLISDSPNRGYCNFIDMWNKSLGGNKLVLMSETELISDSFVTSKIKMPYIILPRVFEYAYYQINDSEFEVSDKVKHLVEKKSYLKLAAEKLKKRCVDIQQGYEYFIVYAVYMTIQCLIQEWKPEKVIFWNALQERHEIMSEVCKEYNINILFFEAGVIPGTIEIDKMGGLGESYPAIRAAEFKELPVEDEDVKKADEVINYLYNSKFNRNIQPDMDIGSLLNRKLRKSMPTILYAGQYEYTSCMYPYSERTKNNFSPMYVSENDAICHLAQLCKANNWNLIYKPHPLTMNRDDMIFPDNVIYLEKGDINTIIDYSDLVITITSSVSYNALIRKKAVLMLGYTQLLNKDCSYEAFSNEKVREQIILALSQGMTDFQREAFGIHVAQMLKYYLYDGLVEAPIRYGRHFNGDFMSAKAELEE